MTKIALLIYIIVAPTLAGIAMVAVLVIGADTGNPVIASVLVGALVAIPVAWLIAKKLSAVEGLVSKS